MQRALADVRAFGASGLAIGRAGVDITALARGFDVELPGRVEKLERVHGPRVPTSGVAEWNLPVANQHIHVVGPLGHAARNFRGSVGDLRKRGGLFDVSAKIDSGRVEDVLDIGAEGVSALGAGRDGKQEAE